MIRRGAFFIGDEVNRTGGVEMIFGQLGNFEKITVAKYCDDIGFENVGNMRDLEECQR